MNTHINLVLVALVMFLVGGIGGYWFGQQRSDENIECPFHEARKEEGLHSGVHRMPDGTMMSNSPTGPEDGMGHMMHMMVTSEREFIEGMIPHHQEAVDTAKEVITRGGTTPEIKTLVENIVVSQEKEIADMKQWYEAWYGTPYVDNGKYQPMMRELESLSGQELDKAFLSDMIMHHMGAIMMARSVASYIEHDEVKQLTAAIINTQTAEIETMRRILQGL